jgi:hypothetical protein
MKDGYLSRFASLLTSVSEFDLQADVTLQGRLVLDRVGDLTVSYAPFEHTQRSARLVIVGITPGAQQARNSLLEARRQLLAGTDHTTVLAAAKVFSSFSGPMRANLVAMLDYIGLNRWLGIPTTAAVWDTRSDLVHFTSALRYPVYVDGKNYAGTPSMTATPILRDLLARCLGEEALTLPDAIWVPLGPKATEGVLWLVREGLLKNQQVLAGLPHPSGANAERIAYFLGRKNATSLSSKTSPTAIDAARNRLTNQVAHFPR